MYILAGALALAEHGAVYIAQCNLDDQQAGADARTLRHSFTGCKKQSTGWAGLLQASVSDQSATPLLVAHGSEKPFRNAFKTFIAIPPGGSKVVYD